MLRRRFENSLEEIRTHVQQLGSAVEQALLSSVEALKQRDLVASQAIIVADNHINHLHHELEAECLRTIALQQPIAGDLRDIATALYIATELERIADYAKTIAKLNIRIGSEPLAEPLVNIPRMAELGMDMLHRRCGHLRNATTELARSIPADDDDVDELYDRVFRRAMQYVQSDPANMDQANYIIMAAYSLERTADRVINICERVVYMVEAEVVDLDEDVLMPLAG